ncbi:hypothetical protein [Acidithiobacillus thiooxidans]|uniref:Uncharacterized protein n=1 Tax=Acidithiobacillus thiooxidans ATCC 19377 TaxID=637390 RepID=A0A543Q3M7_ACITH|nr:hypothetical protein [Acidithiobacillus thiooxidans]MDX5934951.1 hypothetical protein [Acidithiobacillus thiooxidans]TQN50926.1 hypothetical protein DLNHIDIE_00787 [Acidithiobacillus thiooxidans ATCC 19377]
MGLVANIKAQIHRVAEPQILWTPERLEKVTLVADWLTWRKSCASALLWLYFPITVIDIAFFSNTQLAYWFPGVMLLSMIILEPTLAGMTQKAHGMGYRNILMYPWVYGWAKPLMLIMVLWTIVPWSMGNGHHFAIGGAITGAAYLVLGWLARSRLLHGQKTTSMQTVLQKLNIQGV